MSLLPLPISDPPTDAGRLDPAVLADIATGLAAARAQWQGSVGDGPVRLLATPAYEAWAIPWDPGHALDLHDHGESATVVVVVDGELHERSIVDGEVAEQVLGADRVRWLPPGVVHATANRSATRAVSVHVHSPPLSGLTRFGADGEPLGVDLVAHELPAPPATGEGRLLHPSARSSRRDG